MSSWGNRDDIASPGTVALSGLTVTGSGTFFANNYSSGDVISIADAGGDAVINVIANNTSLTLVSNTELTVGTLSGKQYTVSEKPIYVIDTDTNIDGDQVYGVSIAELAGGSGVAAVTVTAAGSGFTVQPIVTITGNGTNATATATAKIVAATLDAPGAGYRVSNQLAVSGGTGTAATLNVTSVSTIAGQDETAFNGVSANGSFVGGTNFDIGDTIELSEGSIITVDNVAANVVTEFTITSSSTSGILVNNATALTQATSGAGNGFTLTLGDNNQQIFGLVLATAGSYTALPTLDDNPLSNVTGSGAGAEADLVVGVNAITVTNPGNGYTAVPTVAISGAGGIGATATATLQSSDRERVAHGGWVAFSDQYTDANGNVRQKTETLVAMSTITGDAADDTGDVALPQ